MSDKLMKEQVDYVSRVDELVERGPGCLFAGPGRGDCRNFLGLPDVLDETTTDVYGKPEEWCWSCWKAEKLNRLAAENAALVEAIQGLISAVTLEEKNRAQCTALDLINPLPESGGDFHGLEKR